jgi:hypothetical protein
MQAHYRDYGSVAGCYSPCLKLTDPKWNNTASGAELHGQGGVNKWVWVKVGVMALQI